MSTIRANKLEHISTTDGGIQLDNSGHVKVDGLQMPSAGPLGARNLLVNGSMIIAQRATQVTGNTNTGYITCDRWRLNIFNYGTWTVDQSTDTPDGFANSLKITCTTADVSPGASDNLNLQQRIEGRDLQSLGFGTGGAKQFTVSFWVKSNKTGNASFAAMHTDASNKLVSFQYTISSADTWEYKTITVPANTTDAFDNDTNRSMQVEWWLGSGSNFTGGSHQNTWAALDNTKRNASNLGVGGAVDDYFQITGIQLEVGAKATSFEHRSYTDELLRCQRYYVEIDGGSSDVFTYSAKGQGTTSVDATIPLSVPLRASPTLNSIDTRAFTDSSSFRTSNSTTPTVIQFNANNPHLAINCAGFTSLTNNEVSLWGLASDTLEINAEL